MSDNSKPIQFIDEPIIVEFKKSSIIEKTPPCPDAFVWDGNHFDVVECINQWHDFSRRGRMARNMKDEHLEAAAKKGSWGVGRFYFRVKVKKGRIFDLYYDRASKNAEHRKGTWVILAERSH